MLEWRTAKHFTPHGFDPAYTRADDAREAPLGEIVMVRVALVVDELHHPDVYWALAVGRGGQHYIDTDPDRGGCDHSGEFGAMTCDRCNPTDPTPPAPHRQP